MKLTENKLRQIIKEEVDKYKRDGTGPHGKGLGPGKGKGCKDDEKEDINETLYKYSVNKHNFSFDDKNDIVKIDNITMSINDFKKIMQFAIKNGLSYK